MYRSLTRLFVLGGLILGAALPVHAQDPASAAPARELSQLLASRKMDSFAARIPGSPDEFAATLVFPGQMIVIWAKFSAPAVLNEKLLKGEFREAYLDLNSASAPEHRYIVTDLGADGLGRGAKDQPADSYDVGNKSMRFTGNWRAVKMNEKDYMKAHADADAEYTRVLGVLLEQIKKAG
jgi:hypothetical protein